MLGGVEKIWVKAPDSRAEIRDTIVPTKEPSSEANRVVNWLHSTGGFSQTRRTIEGSWNQKNAVHLELIGLGPGDLSKSCPVVQTSTCFFYIKCRFFCRAGGAVLMGTAVLPQVGSPTCTSASIVFPFCSLGEGRINQKLQVDSSRAIHGFVFEINQALDRLR